MACQADHGRGSAKGRQAQHQVPLQLLQRALVLSLPALGAAAAVIGLAGHGVVDTIFFRPEVQISGWFALATLGAARQLR